MGFLQKWSHKKMKRKSKQSPSFFKILISDFTRQLRLPPVFVNKYGTVLPECVKLRISTCEKTWKVKLEEMEDSHHFFTHGWNKFVREVGLEMGEFLVFRMTGTAVFRVSVYEITGCKREFPGDQFPSDYEESPEMKYKKCNGPDMKSRKRSRPGNPQLYYEITLKLYRRSRLTLRTTFVEAAGLKRRRHITLEYLPGHRRQLVSLTHQQEPLYRAHLAAGWGAFRRANGMVFGKTYSLEFIRNKNVIQVKEVATSE